MNLSGADSDSDENGAHLNKRLLRSKSSSDLSQEKKRGVNQVIVNVFKAGLENINTDLVTAQIQEASRVKN